MSEAELFWKGGRMSVDSHDLTDAFRGRSGKIFVQSRWRQEHGVRASPPGNRKYSSRHVGALQANICYPNRGRASSKGEAYIKVDWEIYSKLDKAVVHTVRTEGAGRTESAVPAGNTTAVLNAFAQATRNLLADKSSVK